MTAQTMAEGLDISLSGWDVTGLHALWSEEQPYLEGGYRPRLAAVVLGGVLPPSHIQAIAYPWLLGAEVIVKQPSADPLFPRLFCEALGDSITVVERLGLGGVLARADAVGAVGSDDAIAEITLQVPAGTPALRFGHRTAIAVVPGPVARSEPVAADVLRDLATFDQLGCLSPREIVVIGGLADAHHLAGHLARGLAQRDPRAHLGAAVEGALRTDREVHDLRGTPQLGPDDLQWGLRIEDGRLGASRIVPAGQLQAAPPTWPHDGHRPLAALCRWCGRD